jgi:hypothetical protein
MILRAFNYLVRSGGGAAVVGAALLLPTTMVAEALAMLECS